MKPSLQLKLGQQLAMTPQLQQAIRLLQLSTLDLQQEIQEALEANPLLEQDEDQEPIGDSAQEFEHNLDEQPITKTTENLDSATELEQSQIPDDLPVDTTWDEMYSANTGNTGIQSYEEMPVYQGETTESLQDYLHWQLTLTPFSELDRAIATAIIDGVDEKGYLTISVEEILESLGDEEAELDEVEAVLKRVQQFDPLGVASRSLQECLLLQLNTLPKETPWVTEARALLEEYIHLLANRDFRQIIRETKLKESDLKAIMNVIHKLEPRPGNLIHTNDAEYVIPDVFVFKSKGQWQVQINSDSVPKLKN